MKKRVLEFVFLSIFAVVSANVAAQTGYVDLVSAAEKSVPAVVHIKTEFEQVGNSFDYYF